MCPEAKRRLRTGATLVELVIAIVVISIALTGTLMVMDQTTRHSADPMLETQAIAIAEAYLEEILLLPFIDPDLDPLTGPTCPPEETNRTLFDNVCDYRNTDDAGARDQTDAAVAGLEDYRVRVSVDTSATLGALSGSNTVLRVDVRVTHPANIDLMLSGYRTRY